MNLDVDLVDGGHPPGLSSMGGGSVCPGPCLFEAAIALAGLMPGATVHPSLKRK